MFAKSLVAIAGAITLVGFGGLAASAPASAEPAPQYRMHSPGVTGRHFGPARPVNRPPVYRGGTHHGGWHGPPGHRRYWRGGWRGGWWGGVYVGGPYWGGPYYGGSYVYPPGVYGYYGDCVVVKKRIRWHNAYGWHVRWVRRTVCN